MQFLSISEKWINKHAQVIKAFLVHNNGEVAANDLSQADGTVVVSKEGAEALASPPIRILGSSSKCNLASDWPWLLRAAVRAQPTNFRPGPARSRRLSLAGTAGRPISAGNQLGTELGTLH